MSNNICSCCGQILEDGVKFCTFCGMEVPHNKNNEAKNNAEEIKDKESANIKPDESTTEDNTTENISFDTVEPDDDSDEGFTESEIPDITTTTVSAYNERSYYTPDNTSFSQINTDEKPPKKSKYYPISSFGYVGYTILFCVPVIGWIFAIVWACGGTKNINRRRYARATIIMALISIMLWVGAYFLFIKVYTHYKDKSLKELAGNATQITNVITGDSEATADTSTDKALNETSSQVTSQQISEEASDETADAVDNMDTQRGLSN